MRQLAGLLDGTGVMVVSDEVYEHLTFDGRRHVSIASIPELARRAAVISSFGKSFHTTGWKIGYVAAPAAITDEIRRVHQFVTFAVNTPLQHAYAEFLARGVDSPRWAASMRRSGIGFSRWSAVRGCGRCRAPARTSC